MSCEIDSNWSMVGTPPLIPPFDDLVSFLEDECRRVENVPQPKSMEVRIRVQPARIERHREGRIYNSTAMQQPSSRCMYCKEPGHGTPTCFKFGQLRWQARRNIARQRNWCYSCLGNHLASQCQIARPCAQCGGNHHLLLCGNRNGSPPPAASAPKAVAPEDRIIGNINDQWTGRARFGLLGVVLIYHTFIGRRSLFVTRSVSFSPPRAGVPEFPLGFAMQLWIRNVDVALGCHCTIWIGLVWIDNLNMLVMQVSVGSPSGEKVTARALLDSGAQGCIASTWLVERLRLRVEPGGNYIRGVGGVKVPGLVGQVALSFSPLQSSRPRIIVSAIVLLSVATDLGDIIMGPVLSPCPLQGEDDNLQVGLSLAESVQRFWEVEEPPSAPRQNPEHLECESFFQNNTGRLCSGRRGRILRLFLGSDGVPRVAEVLVGDSILKRAVAGLSRLPVT
ncbi:hypothetical protein HW555_012168 [Spodoptera exigua]|uniref:Peptidase A2 domain-containing protein n=1 Tax=Spodoptera exigua TaxID=7107 RepID=A0A835G7K1_SPOEX|nr:hypothetical protein HW555_012168 [Spodoptera exigua]